MRKLIIRAYAFLIFQVLILIIYADTASAWFGKTHLAIAKAGGYKNWHNAAAADLARLKAGDIERFNHYVNNQRETVINPKMVLEQAERYNNPHDRNGHLYGAIVASIRKYIKDKKEGRYPEDQMAYCIHYVGDLSMPLHNIAFTPYNKKYHLETDGIIDHGILDNIEKIQINKITIRTEDDLINEVVRIANISAEFGYRLEAENRVITKKEAYRQVSYSASLLKAIIEYVDSR